MLNQLAFANSLAVLTAVLYVLFAMLALVAPRLFQILFDAQFFGANVASLFPKVQPSAASLVTLVLMIGMSWVVGYAWAWLYNRFAKSLWWVLKLIGIVATGRHRTARVSFWTRSATSSLAATSDEPTTVDANRPRANLQILVMAPSRDHRLRRRAVPRKATRNSSTTP